MNLAYVLIRVIIEGEISENIGINKNVKEI